MPKTTDFLAQKELLNQLRESTIKEARTYNQLLRRLQRDKLNVKFLAKRIKQSNQVLISAGQEPVSLENLPDIQEVDDSEPDEDKIDEPTITKKSRLKKIWDKVPNLAETATAKEDEIK